MYLENILFNSRESTAVFRNRICDFRSDKAPGTSNIVLTDASINLRDGSQGPRYTKPWVHKALGTQGSRYTTSWVEYLIADGVACRSVVGISQPMPNTTGVMNPRLPRRA